LRTLGATWQGLAKWRANTPNNVRTMTVAKLNELPADLVSEAKLMPDGLLDKLHQGEAEARLRYVAGMANAAQGLPAQQFRVVTANARRIRNAIPWAEYKERHEHLDRLLAQAQDMGNSEMIQAYGESLRILEHDHQQAPKIAQAIQAHDARQMRADREAAAKSAAPQRGKLSKAVQAYVDQEIARTVAGLKHEEDMLRAEIALFKAQMER
jgi:hypothetical protein